MSTTERDEHAGHSNFRIKDELVSDLRELAKTVECVARCELSKSITYSWIVWQGTVLNNLEA